MNWAGDNSLRQSNSVIFLFAAYNLIVSQGRQLTQGPFSNDFPTTFHLLRNYFSVFTCKLTLSDNERCHFNKLSWLSQLCQDLPSRQFCLLHRHAEQQLESLLFHKTCEKLCVLLVLVLLILQVGGLSP